jgi:cellulose synthase/poly-beta-1,6-N-acetylglucosamine synthase-like glycosyltransferase
MRAHALEMAFWICIGGVAYNYVGYPLLLFALSVLSQAKSDCLYLISRHSRRCPRSNHDLPRVALLMSVYNEAAVIQSKVKNALETDYPSDRLEFLIGLDAPTDSTAELLSQTQSSWLRVFRFHRQRGKLAVLCALAQQTSAEIVVFTDANTMLEPKCIRNLVRHFADPQVGAVSGEETRVVAPGTDPAAESLYWRYESALKLLETRLNCSLGGNGSVLALRRSLFHPRKQTVVEDFQISLEIRLRGYRVVYDPEAIAVEEIPPTLSAQFARRIRIGAGNYQVLFGNLECLNPLKGLLAFSFFSHRVLRWLAPLLLLIAFSCSVSMAAQNKFATLAGAQCLFYLAAFLGYRLKKKGKPHRLLSVPFHFCLMNVALLFGFFRYLRGVKTLAWKSTPRRVRPETALDKGIGDRRPQQGAVDVSCFPAYQGADLTRVDTQPSLPDPQLSGEFTASMH